MKLSAETFRELARSLTGKKLDPSKERRRSARIEVQSRVPLSLMDNDEALPPVPIMVRDVSPRGINIIYPEPLPAGQQFTVQLLETSKKITLLCTVLHSRPLSSGLHSIGAEFTCVLPMSRQKGAGDERARQRIRQSMLD